MLAALPPSKDRQLRAEASCRAQIGAYRSDYILLFASACSRRREKFNNRYRGPVKYHVGLTTAPALGRRSRLAAHGAHAPPLPNFQTGMPSFLALSARLS
jgi:hypothetical protein